MAFILTPKGSDNFVPDSNPVNPAKWALDVLGGPPLQALGGFAQVGTPGETFNVSKWIVDPPEDQYISFSVRFSLSEVDRIDFFMRATPNLSNGPAIFFISPVGDSATALIQYGTLASTQTLFIPFTVGNLGDVFTCICVGSTQYILRNGVQIATTSLTDSGGFTSVVAAIVDSNNDAGFTNFVVGSAAIGSLNYSVPDARTITTTTPNQSRNVQQTLTFDVPKVLSDVLPKDSRSVVPKDSRASSVLNSRTPGTFGPGE